MFNRGMSRTRSVGFIYSEIDDMRENVSFVFKTNASHPPVSATRGEK